MENESTSESSNEPGFRGVGSGIDWASQLENIAFCVELPFWLLMPSGVLDVSVGGYSTKVIVDNDGIEIQRGRQFSRTSQNTVFLGTKEASRKRQVPAVAIPEGGIFRGTRTLLTFDTFALADAISAFFESDGPRFRSAYHYFASLALGHLPVVNSVINAYRKASIDPHATEVTAWDIPVWFVTRPPDTGCVCLYSHIVEDWYPTYRKGLNGEVDIPYFAASPDDVQHFLSKKDIPGEIEMLDGWSLFHRGRYSDSIRSFVTAIEVLVEAELRRHLSNSGETEDAIERRMESTRNNFDSRLRDYCFVTRQRIPGPQLHYIPYLNGIRLADELDRTRRLRHRIVHHGHRLDHTFAKEMLRAAETTSWLFDWLCDHGDFESRRMKNHVMFFGWRTNATPFESEIQNGRIVVASPVYLQRVSDDAVNDAHVIDSISRVVHWDEILLRSIGQPGNEGRDIEHFVKMAFYELGMGEIADSPFEASKFTIQERFRIEFQGKRVLVFILDIASHMDATHVSQIAEYIAARRQSGVRIDHAILVVNDQSDHWWSERRRCQDAEIDKLSRSKCISIAGTADLAKLVLATIKFGWAGDTIVSELLQGGILRGAPPSSSHVGRIYHVWEKIGIVGVIPAGPDVTFTGGTIAIILKDRVHQERVSEVRRDDQGRLTFATGLDRRDIPLNADVYHLSEILSFDRLSKAGSGSKKSAGEGADIGSEPQGGKATGG